jgi:hypothetical protein
VLRRYIAGFTVLSDFLVEVAEDGELVGGGSTLKRLLRTQAALFDRLVAAVADEYAREADCRPGSSEERRAEHVCRLLAGEPLDTTELDYDFDATHVGVIASGPGAREAVRELAAALDRRLLLIRHGETTVWAWLGGRRPTDLERLERHISSSWPSQVSIAIGEPARELGGWRLTHQQARASFPIALRSSDPLVRYADVALLASVLQDDLLATSLRQLYLGPLEAARDGGEALRNTLRAYFAAERNVSSAAAILGVSRQAVAKRLRMAEEAIGRPLGLCSTELEVALRIRDNKLQSTAGVS